MTTIPADAVISASKDQVSTSTGTDVVILELTNGTYYGLNEVGQTVWEILKQPVPVETIVEKCLDIYEVEPSVCRKDVDNLLSSLLEHKLIQVHDVGTH